MSFYYGQGAVVVTDPNGDSLALLAFIKGKRFAAIQLTVEGGLIAAIQVQVDLSAFPGGRLLRREQ